MFSACRPKEAFSPLVFGKILELSLTSFSIFHLILFHFFLCFFLSFQFQFSFFVFLFSMFVFSFLLIVHLLSFIFFIFYLLSFTPFSVCEHLPNSWTFSEMVNIIEIMNIFLFVNFFKLSIIFPF